MNDLTKHLTSIRLKNGVTLGLLLSTPMIVFNLPRLDALIAGQGRLFDEGEPGPSETRAEEIIAQVEAVSGQTVKERGLLACQFEQNALGVVKSPYVCKWWISSDGEFLAGRVDPEIPQIRALREALLLNDSGATQTGPMWTTHTFSETGVLYGMATPSGFSGMLSFNGMKIPLGHRSALEWLADQSSYHVAGYGLCDLVFPDRGYKMCMSDEVSERLQSTARAMLDEYDLSVQRGAIAMRERASMPELAAFLVRAAQAEIIEWAGNQEDRNNSHDELKESLDTFGRVKNVLDVLANAISSPSSAAFSMAILAGAYLLRSRDKGVAPERRHPRERE